MTDLAFSFLSKTPPFDFRISHPWTKVLALPKTALMLVHAVTQPKWCKFWSLLPLHQHSDYCKHWNEPVFKIRLFRTFNIYIYNLFFLLLFFFFFLSHIYIYLIYIYIWEKKRDFFFFFFFFWLLAFRNKDEFISPQNLSTTASRVDQMSPMSLSASVLLCACWKFAHVSYCLITISIYWNLLCILISSVVKVCNCLMWFLR